MTNQPNNTGGPAFNEMPTKAARNQLHQALNEIRTQATQKAITLIGRIIEHETREGYPFSRIRTHLFSACEELQAAMDLYYSHSLERKNVE